LLTFPYHAEGHPSDGSVLILGPISPKMPGKRIPEFG